MKSLILLGVTAFLLCTRAHAQYADLGTGANKKNIWWFDWAGFTVQEGASRTFVTNDGLAVQVSFSNVSPHVPVPFVMNTWGGSLLYLLYNFSNTAIEPALLDQLSTLNFNYTLTITATRNGQPVPFSIVTADAEASFLGETSTLQTNGGNWQTIEFYRNSSQTDDPLTGCGTQTASITNTYDGNEFIAQQIGQCPVILTTSPASGPLIIQTNSDHGGTLGGMGLAFGIFESVDRGDLPPTYGFAVHQLLYTGANGCAFNPPFPTLTQTTNLYIGQVPGDADPIQYDNDDSIGVDEEGVTSFPPYNNNGSYSLTLPVVNTTGNTAWLTGWFDISGDGTFGSSEFVTVAVPNNATSVTVTWTGLPTWLPIPSAGGFGFRFRISSDQAAIQALVNNSISYAPDGEVEDYFVAPTVLCAPLTLAISPDDSICSGQSVPLLVSGAVSYAWSPGAGLSDPSSADPIASPAVTTTYMVSASTPQGCSANTSITITVKPSPVVTATGQSTICQGTSAVLTASGGNSYSWSTTSQGIVGSAPTLTVSPAQTTAYFVTGKAADGCSAADTVTVSVQPPPKLAAAANQPEACTNSNLTLSAHGGDTYAWTNPNGQSLGSDSSITFIPVIGGDYQVVIDNSFCQLSLTITIPITVNDPPTINVTSTNDISCTLGQTTLNATGASTFQWSGGGVSGNSPDIVVSPRQTTTYFVKGTAPDGCQTVDSINVKVDFSSGLSGYPVPSAFTPNNDGKNDCFGLKYWGQINSLELSVYDRWGVLVFITNDPQGCWDGTFKGVPQPAGTYVYQIKAATTCGTVYRKGTVMLIR